MAIAGTETIAPDTPDELIVADDGGDDINGDAASHSDAASDSVDTEPDTEESDESGPTRRWPTRVARILAYIVLPAVALLLAAAAGYLKWGDGTARTPQVSRTQSGQAAIDSTVAMPSYTPDSVEQNLAAARDRMTGAFRDSYSSLTHDVVIPGADR